MHPIRKLFFCSLLIVRYTTSSLRTRSETTTTATTLAAGRVGGRGSNVLDTADLHARTGQGTEGGLGTGAGGLGAVTTSGTDLDVQGGDAQLLAASGDVLSSQHGGVGRRLVTVGLDLHSTGDTADGFAATGITQNVSLCIKPPECVSLCVWVCVCVPDPNIDPTRTGRVERALFMTRPAILYVRVLCVFGRSTTGTVACFIYLRSVTWTKVSLNEAKIRATPKTSSPKAGFLLVYRHSPDREGTRQKDTKRTWCALTTGRGAGSFTHPRGPGGPRRCSPGRDVESSWEASCWLVVWRDIWCLSTVSLGCGNVKTIILFQCHTQSSVALTGREIEAVSFANPTWGCVDMSTNQSAYSSGSASMFLSRTLTFPTSSFSVRDELFFFPLSNTSRPSQKKTISKVLAVNQSQNVFVRHPSPSLSTTCVRFYARFADCRGPLAGICCHYCLSFSEKKILLQYQLECSLASPSFSRPGIWFAD